MDLNIWYLFVENSKALIQGAFTAANSIVFTIDNTEKTTFFSPDGNGRKCYLISSFA